MNYTDKVIRQSNYCYNDGLRRAKIRDLSGAIISLRRSLQYCQKNVAARNLLGLVYYGRGEVNEALVEWIISKNLKPKDNIANHFIRKVQESSEALDKMNNSIKRYNQCLISCNQDAEDVALIQLRKVITEHPTFLKAYQLSALLYIQKKQYSKAKQLLNKAQRIDTTNADTLYYLNALPKQKKPRKQVEQPGEAISYKVGNDTIIQPAQNVMKQNIGTNHLVNLGIGIIISIAVIVFLIVPSITQSENTANATAVREYSQEIDALRAQINALTTELDGYRLGTENLEEEAMKATKSKESYEALVQAKELYDKESISGKAILDFVLSIEETSLGDEGVKIYNTIKTKVFANQLPKRYENGEAKFNVKDNENAILDLTYVIKMDASYEKYNAMLMLALTYMEVDDLENAKKYFNIIFMDGKDESVLNQVKEQLNAISELEAASTEEPTDEEAAQEEVTQEATEDVTE